MNEILYEGIVREISQPRSFESKDGRSHTERTLLVETDEEYPQTCAVRTVDAVAMQMYALGCRVRCHLKMRATQGKSGVWFTEVKAWRVEMI